MDFTWNGVHLNALVYHRDCPGCHVTVFKGFYTIYWLQILQLFNFSYQVFDLVVLLLDAELILHLSSSKINFTLV